MSEPRIISVYNSKGGAGKTTVSMLVAGTLGGWGREVLVLDADPQGTAFRWHEGPDGDRAFPAEAVRADPDTPVHQQVRDAVAGGGWDYVVIDCPPSIESPIPQSALMVSDLALVPVLLTPGDVWAVHGALELAEGVRRDVNGRLQVGVVPNQASRTRVSDSASRTLVKIADRHHVGLLRTLPRGVAYQEASAIGGLPGDLGRRGTTAKYDSEMLVEEIKNSL